MSIVAVLTSVVAFLLGWFARGLWGRRVAEPEREATEPLPDSKPLPDPKPRKGLQRSLLQTYTNEHLVAFLSFLKFQMGSNRVTKDMMIQIIILINPSPDDYAAFIATLGEKEE